MVRPDRFLKTCQVSENSLTAFVKSFKYHANEDKKEVANLLLQFIKAQEAQISRMNDKADILAVNKIINQFKKATPLYVELVELIESRFKTAKADKLPTEPHQKLINELNTPIESFLVYTLPTGKRKAKRTDPAWKRDNFKKRI